MSRHSPNVFHAESRRAAPGTCVHAGVSLGGIFETALIALCVVAVYKVIKALVWYPLYWTYRLCAWACCWVWRLFVIVSKGAWRLTVFCSKKAWHGVRQLAERPQANTSP